MGVKSPSPTPCSNSGYAYAGDAALIIIVAIGSYRRIRQKK